MVSERKLQSDVIILALLLLIIFPDFKDASFQDSTKF